MLRWVYVHVWSVCAVIYNHYIWREGKEKELLR